MIKLSLRLPLPGLENRLRETFTVANLKPDLGIDVAYMQISKQGELGYRNAHEPNYQYPHRELVNYTGKIWAMSQQQQYMFYVVDGQLNTVVAMNESEDVKQYLKHVRVCQEYALSLSTYLGVCAVLRVRTRAVSRVSSRMDSDWQKIKYLRRRYGMGLGQAKAFLRAEADTGLTLPVRVQDIVDYAH